MESRVRRKSHARFGERDGENRMEQSLYGVPVSTLRLVPSPSAAEVPAPNEAETNPGRGPLTLPLVWPEIIMLQTEPNSPIQTLR